MEATETATATAAMMPLLQVEAEKTRMRVMVAIDESDASLYALRWALDNLFQSAAEIPAEGGGMVTVVHVQPPLQAFIYPFGPGPAAVYAPSTTMDSVRKVQEENTAAILQRALVMCKEKNIKAETLIMDGDPKEMLCEATEQMHVDILVVGSRGLGKLNNNGACDNVYDKDSFRGGLIIVFQLLWLKWEMRKNIFRKRKYLLPIKHPTVLIN